MTLKELVPLYGEQNTECNALKKVVADLNKELKTAIKDAEQQNKDIVIDGWKCKLTVEEVSNMNEERLLEFAKAHSIPVIKQKEYVDFDLLESMIYKEEIPKDVMVEMNNCMETTTKETLRISRVKGAKNEE